MREKRSGKRQASPEGDGPALNFRPSAAIAVYRWRGARPPLLDLDAYQTGTLLCLVFTREGDCSLLPLAWRNEQPDPYDDDPFRPPYPISENALDVETMAQAKAELEGDGWQVSGRLDLHFTGRHTDARFWRGLEPFLKER